MEHFLIQFPHVFIMNGVKQHKGEVFLIALRVLAIALPALMLIQFVLVSIERVKYPFELEWNEGDIAIAAIRVMESKPLYPPPDQGYVPYFYPPLYQMLCGFLFSIFGVSLTIGRAVSLLSSLGLSAAIGIIVYNWTRNAYAAFLAGLFYIATYKISGYWLDLMRIDAFGWFLSFACVMLIFTPKKPSHLQLIIAGFLAVGAAFSKQNVTLPIIAAGVFLFLYHFRRAGSFFLIGAVLTVNIFWFYTTQTENTWLVKYYYQIASHHTVFWEYLADKNRFVGQFLVFVKLPLYFIGGWLAVALTASLAAVVVAVVRTFKNTSSPRPKIVIIFAIIALIGLSVAGYLVFKKSIPPRFPAEAIPYARLIFVMLEAWMVLTVIWLLAGWYHAIPTGLKHFDPQIPLWFLLLTVAATFGGVMGYLKIGGFVNNFIPMLATMALLIGVAFHYLWNLISSRNWFFTRFLIHAGLLVFLVFTIPTFLYREADILPFPNSTQRGEELIEKIRGLEGRIYMPHHNYYAYLANKDVFYSVDAVRDLNWAGVPSPQPLRDALQNAEFDWLILDIDPLNYEWIPQDVRIFIQRNYVKEGNVIDYVHFREMEPVTGCAMKPRFLWRSHKDRIRRTPAYR